MKKYACLLSVLMVVSFLGACKSSDTQTVNGQRVAKKIYLTKEDYMEDLANAAQTDRREVQPNTESNYIFNTVPQVSEDPSIYFFDKHQRPKVPGEYSAQDYKNEKRLWRKPKRYTPEEYYGMQEGSSSGNASTQSYEETYNY